jgi:hypothetical protein
MGFGCIRTLRITRTEYTTINVGNLVFSEYVRFSNGSYSRILKLSQGATDKIGLYKK